VNSLLKELCRDAGPDRQTPRLPGIASRWRTLLEFEDRIFTERNLRFYGSGVAVAYVLLLVWRLFKGQWLVRSSGEPVFIDFCWIWLSGKFAGLSDPARAYNYAEFSAAQAALVGPSLYPYFHFIYPPTLLFFTYPLGLMPYFLAFAVWIIATFLLYQAAIYAIIPRPAALIAAITPIVVPANVQFGQNGFLTAALIGLSLAFMERRPSIAGIFLGLLTYKPQFGVLFPFALLASRNWRVLGSATATSVILALTAAIGFGYRGWPLFIDSLFNRNLSLSPDDGLEITFQSAFGLLHWAEASPRIAWTVHLAVAAIVALTVCAVWAKPIPHFLKAAALCIGSVTVTPYVVRYDLCVLSIAGAFIVSDGLARGFLPGERAALLICVAGLFFLWAPVAPIICAGMLFLVARRIVGYRRDALVASLSPGIAPRSQPQQPPLRPPGRPPHE
jgi:arabinofuranan 3-O-arabinosyltransferase